MHSLNSIYDRDLLISKYFFASQMEENVKQFQRILELACGICDVKSAFITLVGTTKQFVLSQTGIQLDTMNVNQSICQYTIQSKDLLMIPDTRKNSRVSKLGLHASKHKMVFYAGYPLYNIHNKCIGAFCVSHDKTKVLDQYQKSSLETLANSTIKNLDIQRKLLDLILDLDENYQLQRMTSIHGLQLKLAKLQEKILGQNKTIEQQQISLLKSNENLKAFAYIAAHDIKSPARVINSFAQLMNDKLQSSSDIKIAINYSKIIQKASSNLIDLVSSILYYAEADSSKLQMSPVNLTEVIETVEFNLGGVIRSSNATILNQVNSVQVIGHKEQLIQLFQNLISNGIKYQDDFTEPVIKIDKSMHKSKVAISISDNGIGILDQHLDKIFVPFKRLHSSVKYDGTGLGLSTCLKIIENHHSHICVESQAEVGTTFTFALKLSHDSDMWQGERVTD